MYHQKITELHIKQGYTKDELGVCLGTAMRYIEAVLLEEQAQFVNRFKELLKNESVTFDILAFLESVELYHRPHAHKDLFDNEFAQHEITATSKLAASDKIQALGGLESIYSELLLCNKEEMTLYFSRSEKFLDTILTDATELPFRVDSHNHAIAITYSPSKKWTLFDINVKSDEPILSLNNSEQLTHAIFESFPGKLHENQNDRAFSIEAIVTAQDKRMAFFKEKFLAFKEKNSIEKIYQRVEFKNFMYLAALANHAETILEIANLKPELLQKHFGYQENQYGLQEKIYLEDVAKSSNNFAVLKVLAKYRNRAKDFYNEYEKKIKAKQIENEMPGFYAAKLGSVKEIIALANQGEQFEKTTIDGSTVAHVAAKNKQSDIIEVLGKYNFDFNRTDLAGNTVAHIASYEIMEKLIENSTVDFNHKNKVGNTPALTVASVGKFELIKKLIENNRINLNLKDGYNKSLLHYAIKYGHEDIIKNLLKSCSRIIETDYIDLMVEAIKYHRLETIRLLKNYNGLDWSKTNEEGFSLALFATQSGNLEIIREIATLPQIDFNQTYSDYSTAYIATAKKDIALIKLLADLGVNFRDKQIIFSLVRNDSSSDDKILAVINELISLDVDVDELYENGEGVTALSYLFNTNREEFARKIDLRTDFKNTYLIAAKQEDLNLIEFLVELGFSLYQPLTFMRESLKQISEKSDVEIKLSIEQFFSANNNIELFTLYPYQLANLFKSKKLAEYILKNSNVVIYKEIKSIFDMIDKLKDAGNMLIDNGEFINSKNGNLMTEFSQQLKDKLLLYLIVEKHNEPKDKKIVFQQIKSLLNKGYKELGDNIEDIYIELKANFNVNKLEKLISNYSFFSPNQTQKIIENIKQKFENLEETNTSNFNKH